MKKQAVTKRPHHFARLASALLLALWLWPALGRTQTPAPVPSDPNAAIPGAVTDANNANNANNANSLNSLTEQQSATETRPAQRTVVKKDDGADPWVPGSNTWGARGMLRVESAHAARTMSLVFSLSHEMSIVSNFFTNPDHNTYQTQRLYVMWTPLPGFEFALSEGLVTDTYHSFYDHNIQVLGNPMLNLKYSFSPVPHLGLGVAASLLIPSATRTNGLVPRAFTLSPTLVATYEWLQVVEASLNIGYAYDQSTKLSGNLGPEDRFAFNQSSYSGLTYGLGVLGAINVADLVGIGPFVEVSGRAAFALPFKENPMRGTAGVKVYWWDSHFLELNLSGDLRLAGPPKAGASYPGLPPWAFFAEISLHLFDHAEPQEVLVGMPPCNADSDCGTGQTCHEHICVITTVITNEVVKEVKQETFTLGGKVLDAETGRPVLDAAVVVKGFEKTPLTVDYKTGSYHSFPLPTGEGLIQLSAVAPNYKTEEQTLARGKPNEEKVVSFNLKRADKPAVGRVQGSLKDAKTGRPIPGGSLHIIALNQKITADERGFFSAEVRAGRYDIVISAPKYITQRKKLILHDGDVIILNVDLAGGGKGRGRR